MARVYATAQEVDDLVGITPTDTTLRRASRAVDRILAGATYDVDSDGMPTDPDVVECLREMVAEQVAWFVELGDETGVAAMSGGSIGSVTLPQVGGGRQSATDVLKAPAAVTAARSCPKITWRVSY